jgi:hypothetical protein
MRPLTIATLLVMLCAIPALSQSYEHLLAGPEWFDGSLMLNNGHEIRGLIKYNDKTDIVSIESARLSKSFTARQVKAFEFYDEVEKKQRVFYSVDIEDRVYQVQRPLFFEVLVELQDFALLSKIAPIRVDKREYATPAMFNPATGGFSAGRYYGYPSTISHTETLFFFTRDGKLKPFLEIKEKEIDGMFGDRSVVKNKVVNPDLLKRYTSSHYSQLISYAEKNDLNLKEKEGLVSLLNHYRHLKN